MESLVESMATSITGISTNALSAMGTVMPPALLVLGGFAIVNLGVKVFKSVGGLK